MYIVSCSNYSVVKSRIHVVSCRAHCLSSCHKAILYCQCLSGRHASKSLHIYLNIYHIHTYIIYIISIINFFVCIRRPAFMPCVGCCRAAESRSRAASSCAIPLHISAKQLVKLVFASVFLYIAYIQVYAYNCLAFFDLAICDPLKFSHLAICASPNDSGNVIKAEYLQ